MKNFTIRSFMNYLFNLETETNKLDDHYSLSLLRDILLLTELLASAVLPEWKIIHERAQFLVGWLEVQNKSSQKNLISLSEHSSLIHHSEPSSSSLSSSKEYFGSLLDFSFALRSSFIGASGGELAVGLVKRQPNEKAMA